MLTVEAQFSKTTEIILRELASATAIRRLDERVASLEKDMTVLEKYVNQWTEGAETYLLALRRVAEEKLQIDFSSYLQAAETQPAQDSDDINPTDTQ